MNMLEICATLREKLPLFSWAIILYAHAVINFPRRSGTGFQRRDEFKKAKAETKTGKTAMHELPVTESILNILLKHAEKNHVSRIVSVTLHIGELSDLENEWLQHYFDYLSKDTVAAGAVLRIERLPIVLRCGKCAHQFEIAKERMGICNCPQCGADKDFTLVSGRQYYIKEMEAM